MVSCATDICGPVFRSGCNTLTTLLRVAVICLLTHAVTGEVPRDLGATKDLAKEEATKDTVTPLDCAACPKRITTCHPSHDATVDFKSIECNSNCLSCNELLPIARAQLNTNNRILKQLDEMRNDTPSADSDTKPSTRSRGPRDCKEVQAAGFNTSDRYAIYPEDGGDPFFVFCDMETDGGGWTVLHRRKNGFVDFYLTWNDYKDGFGSVAGEHWLGNEKIHRLTSQKTYELRVDLKDFDGNTRYAEYNWFLLADESLHYQLIVGDYNGDAGDCLTHHSGMKFTTKDRDLDLRQDENCAQRFHGAWWYRSCHQSNLNGDYLGGHTSTHGTGVIWSKWKGTYYSLKETEMKIRPLN